MTVTQDETTAPLGDEEGAEPSEAAEPAAGTDAAIEPQAAVGAETLELAAEEAEVGLGEAVAEAAETGPASDGAVAEDDEWADDDEPVTVSPYDQPGRWFVVHTYAGYENKVK
ncbi:MAG: transcription termination/antitermination protein NusG, partial [Acidimicrobiales bacterium]